MTTYLSHELIGDLDAAVAQRAATRPGRLRISTGGRDIALTRIWEGGFAIPAGESLGLRGEVDLYDGGRYLGVGLAYLTGETGREREFAFKRLTPPRAEAPRDFAPGEGAIQREELRLPPPV